MGIQIDFSTQLSLVRRKLTKISKTLKDDLDKELLFIAEETVWQLRETTPGEELPKGWTVVKVPQDGRARSSYIVINKDPRANKPVRSSGRNLLHILEYGTAAHPIEAKSAPVLSFFWEKLGINVKFRSVRHPGTRPYFFIRPAVAEAKKKQAAATRRLANRIRAELG